MSERISDKEWYRETCEKLTEYPVKKKRMEYLEYKMQRDCMPSAKMIATYTEPNFGHDSDLSEERELLELQIYCKGIELALESLTQQEKDIIRVKYFDGLRDIDAQCEIEVSAPTYYIKRDNAIKKIAQCIGLFRCINLFD